MADVLTRDGVPAARKWNLNDIMTEGEISSYIADVKKGCVELKSFDGKVTEQNALALLETMSRVSHSLAKVYVYVHLKSDEDKSNAKYQELSETVSMIAVDYSEATSFIAPSFASFKTVDLKRMLNEEAFSDFSTFLDGILREKKHLLSAKEEALLAKVGSFADDFSTVFTMFDNVDVNMGEIELDGEKQKITHGLYSLLMQNKDKAIRKEAYESMYKGYIAAINTLAANYAGNVKQNCFYAKARKYPSALAAALYVENIPVKVYDNLLGVVGKYTPLMHKYVALRKKALKLDVLNMYDLYLPIVNDVDKLYGYDEAYEIVTEALRPLGKDYLNVFSSAKTNGWIDVEETANKKSGAYSWGVYGTHPYVLLNHKGTVHDVFTLAHEMGHAMHSYYSNKTQCYEKSDYVIFVAEIASTVNEVLLIKHLLKTAEGKERVYLLSYYIDMIRTTLFRQTMFAEFEKFTHESVEKGEPLSAEKMTEYYRGLNEKYYGAAVVSDREIGYEWARIPHFYRDFYVYKYATGITCAVNIANRILSDSTYVEKYKRFLSAGSSLYPMEILSLVDLDLTKKEPFEFTMREFGATLKELSKAIR